MPFPLLAPISYSQSSSQLVKYIFIKCNSCFIIQRHVGNPCPEGQGGATSRPLQRTFLDMGAHLPAALLCLLQGEVHMPSVPWAVLHRRVPSEFRVSRPVLQLQKSDVGSREMEGLGAARSLPSNLAHRTIARGQSALLWGSGS